MYKRTAAGNTAALDPRSSLPRKLRILLISVDGRTRQSVYVKTLSSLGDVEAHLDSLLQQGYIELIATDATTTGQPGWQVTGAPSSSEPKFANSAATSSHALDSAFKAAGIRNSGSPSDDISSWDRFRPEPQPFSLTAGNAAVAPASRAGAPPSSAQYQLRSAISLMSDFVTTHLPADALEIVLALEGLASVEQVIASLKGYQAMISPSGAAGAGHLEELRDLLSRY